MRRILLPGVLALAAVYGTTTPGAGSSLPPRLESYLTAVSATAKDREALVNGEPVTRMLDSDASKEVAVFGAIWIAAPIHRYVTAIQDIEGFERGGGFKVTKRISNPPALADFAALQLPDEDLDDLRKCRVGDCEIQLGEASLQRFHDEIDWNGAGAPQAANALMRQIALEYVTGYLQRGNHALAVYRDTARPTFAAREFRTMVDAMPELSTHMPDVRRYLLEYPRVTLPGATSFLYWQETEFGLKPTIRISHLTVREAADETVVASKMIYATHYFWTALEVRVLVPDPSRGPGFWFLSANRSRSDGLSGFTGLFVRRRVRREVKKGMESALTRTKRVLEAR
jgi:hypothetical protein